MWIVMCRVTGGVTGTREGFLKGKDGGVKYFETEAEAKTEAARLMAPRDGFRGAYYLYWAEAAR